MKNSDLKNRNIFNVSFAYYEFITIRKNAEMGKALNSGQVQFLRFPFITSIISAKRRRETVRSGNIRFYYQIKQPQLKLFQ